MGESIARTKSYRFALRILEVGKDLTARRHYQLASQLIRSGTSIGANLEEAAGAISRKEFIQKTAISYKEARETLYWLRLLTDSGTIDPGVGASYIQDCTELCRIIAAILKTTKQNTPDTSPPLTT